MLRIIPLCRLLRCQLNFDALNVRVVRTLRVFLRIMLICCPFHSLRVFWFRVRKPHAQRGSSAGAVQGETSVGAPHFQRRYLPADHPLFPRLVALPWWNKTPASRRFQRCRRPWQRNRCETRETGFRCYTSRGRCEGQLVDRVRPSRHYSYWS